MRLPLFFGLSVCAVLTAHGATGGEPLLPRALSSYADPANGSVLEILGHRIRSEPFNLVATIIFVLAIIHTFLTSKFRHWSHLAEERHAARQAGGKQILSAPHSSARAGGDGDGWPDEVSFKGQLFHFLGEIEAVFGLWALALMAAIMAFFGWGAAVDYVGHRVSFTEAMFVVVIMAIAGTRPILRCAEAFLRIVAGFGRGTAGAWWLAILIVAPVLGSFITEPAAMTIGALLLAQQFYALKPSPRFAYATLGLLFVNISVGGTLTQFAAPPVLMVAGPWGWDMVFMLTNFGWKAVIGIVIATILHFFAFRKELEALDRQRVDAAASPSGGKNVPPKTKTRPVPVWITLVHLGFLGFTVFVAHHPPLFIGGFLFFLAFSQATAHHQGKLELKALLLVGFFLAGLAVHGGLRGW